MGCSTVRHCEVLSGIIWCCWTSSETVWDHFLGILRHCKARFGVLRCFQAFSLFVRRLQTSMSIVELHQTISFIAWCSQALSIAWYRSVSWVILKHQQVWLGIIRLCQASSFIDHCHCTLSDIISHCKVLGVIRHFQVFFGCSQGLSGIFRYHWSMLGVLKHHQTSLDIIR